MSSNETELDITDNTAQTCSTRAADFGDLPDSYNTLRTSNGPWHLVNPNLTMGTIDNEADGFDSNGDGDDGNGSDDEDGVAFSFPGGGGVAAIHATVNVTNTTGNPAVVCGWLDIFSDGGGGSANLSGVLSGQTGGSLCETAGSDDLVFVWDGLPPVTGATYARFRLCDSIADCGAPTGFAAIGEVEDYRLTFDFTALDPPTVTKTFTPASITVGGTSTLIITLANSNALSATLSADLVDNLPAGVMVAATPNLGGTCPDAASATPGGSSIAYHSGGAIPAGGSCTITVNVSSNTPDTYTNTIAIDGLQTDLGNNLSAASANLTVVGIPSLTIVKTQTSGANPVSAPGSLGYQIVVTNDGSLNLTNVIVNDTLPDGSTGSLSGPTESGAADGVLAPGETFTYTTSYTVTQADIDTGVTLTNTASVVTDELTTPEIDTADTTITQNASIRVTKNRTTISGVGGNGDTVTYDIVVENTGNTTVLNIDVMDASAAVTGSPITSLAVGASTTLTAVQTITATDAANGYVVNSATATGDSSPTTIDNVSDVSDTGVDAHGLAIADNENTETPDGAGAANGDATDDPTVTALGVSLHVRVLLQGALNVPGSFTFTTLMRDDMRAADQSPGVTKDYMPDADPYPGLPAFTHVGDSATRTATVVNPGAVFADHGDDSVVDWVFVELRDAGDNTSVIATRAGLVQRDGDVVDMDGVSPLVFSSTASASYFVSVNHRNHLGVMTENAIPLSSITTLVDFTDPSIALYDTAPVNDGLEQFQIPGSSLQALWAGNVGADSSVVFTGQDNDTTPLFNEITQAPANGGNSEVFVHQGYHQSDANMSGAGIFAGQNNDTDLIFNNITQHPANGGGAVIFVIVEQLP